MPDYGGAAEGAADNVKGGLTHKLGPLPVWAWAGIAVVGVFFVLPNVSGLLGGANSAGSTATTDPNASILPDGTTSAQDQNTTLSGQLTQLQGTDSSILAALTSPIPSATSTPGAAPAAGGISQDVQNIYSDLLQRPVGSADLAGEEYWNSQGLDQLHTLTAVESTKEAQALAASNPVAYVTGQYQYTGQTPDQAGINYWDTYITQHGAVQEANAFANATAAERGQAPVVK